MSIALSRGWLQRIGSGAAAQTRVLAPVARALVRGAVLSGHNHADNTMKATFSSAQIVLDGDGVQADGENGVRV